jgi:ubiquinone biosynthesis accessory factor UbiJ
MIKLYSLRMLESAINAALKLDETYLNKIATLDGKVLQLVVTPLQLTFYIHFTIKGIILLQSSEHSDAIIYSSPIGLIRLSFLPASRARSLFNDGIRIEGEVAFAQAVKALFDGLELDWEGHLAQFTGDMVAHGIGACFRKAQRFAEHAHSSFNFQASSYLHEELPSPEEISDFCDAVDELKLDIERLEAKVNKRKQAE